MSHSNRVNWNQTYRQYENSTKYEIILMIEYVIDIKCFIETSDCCTMAMAMLLAKRAKNIQ